MSKHVQNQYDMKWYDSQTCLHSTLVQNQYDMNWYDSQTCLNLFRINVIWIDMILKYVYSYSNSLWYELIQFLNMSRLEMKTWWNSLKLSKWHEEVSNWKIDSLDCFEQVERSKSLKNWALEMAQNKQRTGNERGHWKFLA